VHADVTAVFPWLTYALLSDATVHKKHRRLYDVRAAAVKTLDKQIQKRHKALMKTVEMPRSVGKIK
jgi:deoxyhypusine synthase